MSLSSGADQRDDFALPLQLASVSCAFDVIDATTRALPAKCSHWQGLGLAVKVKCGS